jgi:3-dehydroquinate dehydratase
MEQLTNNFNELKGAMENLTDNDLIEMRIDLLNLIDECLEIIPEQ